MVGHGRVGQSVAVWVNGLTYFDFSACTFQIFQLPVIDAVPCRLAP